MENWTDLYQELAQKISNNLSTHIKWIDLWHDQIAYLTTELPFPSPAVFIGFNTKSITDKSILIQDINLQIDFYLFYETFSDTYQGAYNQQSALDFMRILTLIHQLFHGQSGVNYSNLTRSDLKRVESGGAGNLYVISFDTVVEDASAVVQYNQQQVNQVQVTPQPSMPVPAIDTNQLYII